MKLTGPGRGVAVSVAGLATTLALAVGCSSTTSGNPATAPGPATGSASISASLPSTTPVLPGPSSTGGAPVGSAAAFCAELSGTGLPQVGNPSAGRGLGPVLAKWDRLAAVAPAEIKQDVALVDDVLHRVASGSYPTQKLAQYGTAFQHIASYIGEHCR